MVHVQKHPENQTREESLHALSCHYDVSLDSALQQPSRQPERTDVPKATPPEFKNRPFIRKHRNKRSSNKKEEATLLNQKNVTIPRELNKEGVGFNANAVTSAPSVLQLNVIDQDGRMTTVVYPGKRVALELHTAHNCKYTVQINVEKVYIVHYIIRYDWKFDSGPFKQVADENIYSDV